KFYAFNVVVKLHRNVITVREHLLEIALEPQVTAVKHEWIDVTPHNAQIRSLADSAVEVGRGGNRNVGADFAAASRANRRCRSGIGGDHGRRSEHMRGKRRRASGWVH